ncbi:urease accessory protein [Thiocapsa imhoffii]|uniref:Urease accessory protein UreD n=1 Tax=Thiocapsa imhoffii TaxID=382777 RepID=A0A9X0WIG3_9GAMM|nr:urease accessory protein UreD [Thiocapsa imhoffii]MBK1644707.1 urease accessory protein [Thiocapsa imhoffii]
MKRPCTDPIDPVVGPSGEWSGRLQLDIGVRAGRSRVIRKEQRGPLTLQRAFHPEGAPCHLYLLHPPGGVVGGDRLEIEIGVATGAHALITAPGATKFYRSAGPVARQRLALRVATGAVLEWLPHENIFFSGAACALDLVIDLVGDGRFLGWEVHCFGRPTIAERFLGGQVESGLRVQRDGKPILDERLRVAGLAALNGPALLRGFPICATFILTGVDSSQLALARRRLDSCSDFPVAATLLDDLLLIRALAHEVEPVTLLFGALWSDLRPAVLGLAACPPRIWAT